MRIKSLFFLILGFSSFFVKMEPSPFDIIILFSFVLDYRKFNLKSILILLLFYILFNISSFFSFDPEKSFFYNAVTIYIFVLCFYFYQINKTNLRYFVVGSLISCVFTLLLSTFQLVDSFWYYDRLMGGFKDPNVLAPSSIFMSILFHRLFPNQRILNLIVILITSLVVFFAQSRIAILVLILYLLFYIKKYIILVIPFFFLFYYNILEFIEKTFSFKNYDTVRFQSQSQAMNLSSFFGNGATSSDFIVGHAPHSLYVRIISDNGILVASCLLILIFYFLFHYLKKIINKKEFLFLVSLFFIFSFVIDTLHWRHASIYLAALCSIYINSKIIPKYDIGRA